MKRTPKELRDPVELDLSQLETIVGGGFAEQNGAEIDSSLNLYGKGESLTAPQRDGK